MKNSEIKFIDTTLRDGNQSLWDATGLKTETILKLAPLVDQVGFKAVDFTSSIHMGVAVRYHKENPWEKIRLAARAMPHTPLSFGTTGRRFIGFKRSPDSVMALVMERMAANGIRRVWLIDAAHEMTVINNNARMAKAAGIDDFVVALSYTISPVHTDEYYAAKADEIARNPDVDTIYLKDQGGLLTPERVQTLIPAIQPNLHGKPFEIHSHCTTGLALQVYREAVRLGVDTVHTAIPPLADGTSQPSIFDVLESLRSDGHQTHVRDNTLQEISKILHDLARNESRSPGAPQSYDPSYYEHQVPGGMVSTLKRQLAEAGMTDRLAEVMIEIVRVRKDLGYPIMVTPLSQFVATQATMNVVSGERYKMVPDGVIEYVLGYFGESPAPIDGEVKEKVHGLSKAKKMLDHEFPQPSVEELRCQLGLGRHVSDDEFLLRFALSESDVDAVTQDKQETV